MSATYQQDFYAWVYEQANHLKMGNFKNLDIFNLAEEVETMGRSELSQLQSRLEVLIMHLLKYQFQPAKRSRSWNSTIKEQRKRLELLLKNSPSLKHKMVADDFLPDIWELAVLSASSETGLDTTSFPEQPIWTLEQIMDSEFYPKNDDEIVE